MTDWGAVLSASGNFKPNFISVAQAKRTTAPQVRLLSEGKQPIAGARATFLCVNPSTHAPVPIALANNEAFSVFIDQVLRRRRRPHD